MDCKVCGKPIEEHDIDALLECVGDSKAGKTYLEAVGWALGEGFLKSRGSDAGSIVLSFRNGDEVRTRSGAEAIYSHYLTKVKRGKRKLFGSNDDDEPEEEPDAPFVDEGDDI